jgi:hypothetical protein
MNKKERISDLEGTLREVEEFLASAKSTIAELRQVQTAILDIHRPYVDASPTQGIQSRQMVLRCTICDTPEHHTWGPDNDEPWPCATVRTFMSLPAHDPEEEVA